MNPAEPAADLVCAATAGHELAPDHCGDRRSWGCSCGAFKMAGEGALVLGMFIDHVMTSRAQTRQRG